MTVVATHNQQSDCWTVIDGKVYNLTDWIAQHPGGAAPILGLCGTDGTSAFQAQHGSQPRPNDRLAQFLVGALAAGELLRRAALGGAAGDVDVPENAEPVGEQPVVIAHICRSSGMGTWPPSLRASQ